MKKLLFYDDSSRIASRTTHHDISTEVLGGGGGGVSFENAQNNCLPKINEGKQPPKKTAAAPQQVVI
jgi:hypothetical protein